MKPDDTHLRTVQVLYFARLRERFEREREDLPLPASVIDVAGLAAWLRQRGEPWATELAHGKAYRVAVNQDMAEGGTLLKAGDEVAFFPPVTGG